MPTGQCRLCQEDSELQLSHVLPAFVFRWLRESAGGAHLRSSDAPNRRVQDGLKHHWLCSTCEGVLRISEGHFANRLFLPYTNDTAKRVSYSTWLMHFCTSVSWRVLRAALERNEFDGWSAEAAARLHVADAAWRDVLLGKRPHAGDQQQHMLPLDRIESTNGGSLAPNINRYLMRAVQMDLCVAGETMFTFAKLGRFIIIGFIHEPQMDRWRGTKVHANDGIIQPRKYVVPGILGNYLNEKADEMAAALRRMSDAQHTKVDKAFRDNVDQYIDSDAYDAMIADLAMFGDAAFSKR